MSDNNSGKKKTLTGREMHDRIETLLAFLNRNLRGKEEAVNLSLLSAIATENILLLGQPGKDKNLIGRCIASALKDCYNEEWKFCPYEQHAYSESCSDSTNIVFIDDILVEE